MLDVQKAVNNMPHEAHGGTLTPAQVLYGQPEAASQLPHPDELASLLGFSRCGWWAGGAEVLVDSCALLGECEEGRHGNAAAACKQTRSPVVRAY